MEGIDALKRIYSIRISRDVAARTIDLASFIVSAPSKVGPTTTGVKAVATCCQSIAYIWTVDLTSVASVVPSE